MTDGRDVVPIINELLKLPFALKVATKDHHPPSHVSFASTHLNKQPFVSFITVSNPVNPAEHYETRLWPDHCVVGTLGNELTAELDTTRVDRIVLKGQDPRVEMYSAFSSPLRNPPLASATSDLGALLKESAITDVYVVGLAGDYCVKATALDAATGGWRTYVVEEAVRCVNGAEGWASTVQELSSKGIHVVSVDGEELTSVRQLAL